MNDILDLIIYRKALEFSNKIWDIVKQWDYFTKITIGVQLTKAADSISSNIAEGYGRFHFKENLNFCYYSRGSFEEVKDWLRKSYARNLINESEKKYIDEFVSRFPKQLNAYINYIRRSMKKQTNLTNSTNSTSSTNKESR